MNYIFTSESVSDGHPDKVADQISDALVDAGLKAGDTTTRVAVETLVTTNMVTVAGEVKNFNVTREEVKVATEKAAAPKIDTSSEKLAGFDAAHIRSFKTIVSNIRAYVSAVNSGNTVRSSQVCDLLDENYNGSLRGVYTRSVNTQIQDVLDFAKDSMYAGVVDCTRGYRKSRVDLIGDSVTAFIAASKYLDGLVLASEVK